MSMVGRGVYATSLYAWPAAQVRRDLPSSSGRVHVWVEGGETGDHEDGAGRNRGVASSRQSTLLHSVVFVSLHDRAACACVCDACTDDLGAPWGEE